jgi:multiple sugar transport system substrate-binding protein
LRFWTSQGAPVQMAAWKDIFQRFEQQHPQYTVAIELFSDDDVWPKLTAGFAAHDVPDLVSYVQAYTVATLAANDLLEPFDDVVKAVGEDDFFPAMRDVYKYQGHYIAATLNNQTSSNLWYRTDLLAETGLAAPKTWDEQLVLAKQMTKGDVYGNSLPFGRTSMTSTMMVNFVHQAGGLIVNPDGSVGFNSPATVTALEFLRDIAPYAPPGATGYSWGEVLNSYTTGRAAMAPLSRRRTRNCSTAFRWFHTPTAPAVVPHSTAPSTRSSSRAAPRRWKARSCWPSRCSRSGTTSSSCTPHLGTTCPR